MGAPARKRQLHISLKILLFMTAFVFVCFITILTSPPLAAAPTQPTPIALTPAERSWLQQHPVIRLAPDPEFKPIEFFDRLGHYRGVAADNIKVLEGKLGVKFTIVRAKNWDEVLKKFRNNEIDLLGAIVATPNRRGFMRISAPLFQVPGAIIVRNSVEHGLTVDDLRDRGMKVAVVSSYTAHDIFKNRYPDIHLEVVPDTATGLAKVSFGLVDAYVENLATATLYMQEMGITNIHNAGTPPFVYDWGIGIRKDWPELETILNKGIAAITLEERQAVLNHWIPVSPGWRPGKVLIGSVATVVGILLFVAIVIWNGTLTRKVSEQTAQLRNEVEERKRAEDEVRSLNEELEDRVDARTAELELEIDERQKAQELLLESESHLKVVADYATNWEYWRLPDNSFLYMSPSVQELTGYSVEEFKCDRELLYRVIHHEDREMFRHHIHELGPSGQILPIELRIWHKKGDLRWISHVCQQVFSPSSQPWGWRASNQDITKRKQIEQELFQRTEELEDEVAKREVAQDELEQLNRSLEERIHQSVTELRQKDQALIQQGRLAAMGEMINNIAHQWRQPLNNIGLIIQNLQFSFSDNSISHDELKLEISKAMDIIMQMSHTIDDFRNFFRDDKRKSAFNVNNAVHYALEFISATLTNHNITVELEADEQVTAVGYYNEYAQVLLNVLSNTREACVERKIAAPKTHIRVTSENGRSVVYISDNCGGIADDIMPKIFDPYFTTRTPDKGTGIGLYMSKVIIEQHMGGHLSASNIECGVAFRIEV